MDSDILKEHEEELDENTIEEENKEIFQRRDSGEGEAFDEELRIMDSRLSKTVRALLLREAHIDGFDSPCMWIYWNIKSITPPRTMTDRTGISKDTYLGIVNRILNIRQDPLLIESNHKWRLSQRDKDGNLKMCGLCGKRQRVGWYYCQLCLKKIKKVIKEIDVEMYGDF